MVFWHVELVPDIKDIPIILRHSLSMIFDANKGGIPLLSSRPNI